MEFTSKTIESLQYFKGKACTIITEPINRNFEEKIARRHFVVHVQELTRDAIWGFRDDDGTLAFFPMSKVISIQEEQVLDPINNPEHKKMIEEYEKTTGKKIVSDVSPHKTPTIANQIITKEETLPHQEAAFVDINRLTQLAKQSKESLKNR